MKIHNENPVNRLQGLLDRLDETERGERTGRPGEGGGTRVPGDIPGSGGDGFEVSMRAREIAELRGTIEGLPDVRERLVQRLREEIASGLYRADGRRIADAMLDEEGAFADRVGRTGSPREN